MIYILLLTSFWFGYYLGWLRCKKNFAEKVVEKFNYCYMDLTAQKPIKNKTLKNRIKEYFNN